MKTVILRAKNTLRMTVFCSNSKSSIVGALGSVVSLGGGFRGAVAILAGVFMMIMGLNMMNVFPALRRFTIKMPKFLGRKIGKKKAESNSSFYIGLLNGLMPCGLLQSMQLFALSTGSFVYGALSGLTLPFQNNSGPSMTAQIEGNLQTITTPLDFGTYPQITVKKDVPVKWIIQAEKGKINGCNNEFIIPKYDLNIELHEGENIIEFTPTEAGEIGYSCWMGMIRSSITVIE